MDQATGDLEELAAALSGTGYPCWTRILIDRSSGSGQVWHLDVLVGPKPPGWRTQRWEYPEANMAMVAVEIKAEALTQVVSETGGDLTLSGAEVLSVPALQKSLNVMHRPSLATYEMPRLEWPHREYTVYSPARPMQQLPQMMVVGHQAPPFPTMGNAFAAFFYGDFSEPNSRQGPSHFGRFRIEDTTGRIQRIQVGATRVQVAVDGAEVEGTQVQILGASIHAEKTVGKRRRVTFPTSNGLPEGTWIWLTRPSQWIDYRRIGSSFAHTQSPGLDDIEFDLPVDAAADLASLIAQGEGLELEFKEKLPDSDKEKLSTFKSVVAFANTEGGKLIFGVNDEGTIVGIDDAEQQSTRDRLDQMIRAMVSPWPTCRSEAHRVNDCRILVLTVEAGSGEVFGVTVPPKAPAKFYVRRGGTSTPATAEELRACANRGRSDAPTAPWLGHRLGGDVS